MVRKVFFSFHYDRDVFRVMQVRNSWVVRGENEAQPFYDKAEFESVKRSNGGIERWIETQLSGTSVTVVLYGAETIKRPWVKYEIKRSFELGKGLLAIDIHGIKDPRVGSDVPGQNPLNLFQVQRGGATFTLGQLYRSYNWLNDGGFTNINRWIEDAATAAGR